MTAIMAIVAGGSVVMTAAGVTAAIGDLVDHVRIIAIVAPGGGRTDHPQEGARARLHLRLPRTRGSNRSSAGDQSNAGNETIAARLSRDCRSISALSLTRKGSRLWRDGSITAGWPTR